MEEVKIDTNIRVKRFRNNNEVVYRKFRNEKNERK